MSEIFSDPDWQMTLGERAALEGILCERKPRLAIELGTAAGGSLRRIAAHAEEVHSFDLVAPPAAVQGIANVSLHTGDSHHLLPVVLNRFAEEGRNVDFALVDGDRSADGVRADLEALLGSAAVADTVIVVHDSANEQVRAGLDAVHYGAFPKVAHVNLDFVPGYMRRDPGHSHELDGGLGLVVVDATRKAYFPDRPVVEDRYYEAGHLYPEIRALVIATESAEPASAREAREQRTLAAELDAARAERDRYRQLSHSVVTSLSWKVTAPLRAATHRARRAATKAPGP
jgi:hypothetical protein